MPIPFYAVNKKWRCPLCRIGGYAETCAESHLLEHLPVIANISDVQRDRPGRYWSQFTAYVMCWCGFSCGVSPVRTSKIFFEHVLLTPERHFQAYLAFQLGISDRTGQDC